MSASSHIEKLVDRYPFNESELEQLLKCHAAIIKNGGDEGTAFLLKLAMSSSTSEFFLPYEERQKRIEMVIEKVLPSRFGKKLEEAIMKDSFVYLANEGEEKHLELFLEGLADCGRRGPKAALKILYDCCDTVSPEYEAVRASNLIGLCRRLAIASHLIVAPSEYVEKFLDRGDDEASFGAPSCLVASLVKAQVEREGEESLTEKKTVSKATFTEWADTTVPMISSTLSTFLQNVLFPGHRLPPSRTPFIKPQLYENSDFFDESESSLLFTLACMSPRLNGKWKRLYNLDADGNSFNRMEYALLGYSGPTIMIIGAEHDTILGIFTSSTWKESNRYYGDGDCFLFQLNPCVQTFRATGQETNYMYLNPTTRNRSKINGKSHGIGFGGNAEIPRLFLRESFENCIAGSLDKTYESGKLVPEELLETFNVKKLEVWGVGGDEVIAAALQNQEKFRDVTDSNVRKAKVVTDKAQFLDDFETGLIDAKVFTHQAQVRGRADFTVDEEHGGYKLERK